MRINVSYSSKTYGNTYTSSSSYNYECNKFGSGLHISIEFLFRDFYYRHGRASISFSSDQEALNFAHSIISMVHLDRKQLKIEVKDGRSSTR